MTLRKDGTLSFVPPIQEAMIYAYNRPSGFAGEIKWRQTDFK